MIASLHDACREYKSIVKVILDHINKRHYQSISSTRAKSLDPLVRKISQILLQLHVSPNTSCFYGLPLSVTQGDDGTAKTADWIGRKEYDHWIISSSDSLWCAWRQNAEYFQVIIKHTCTKDGFSKTLQELETLLINQT
jgi:hypothetical protein